MHLGVELEDLVRRFAHEVLLESLGAPLGGVLAVHRTERARIALYADIALVGSGVGIPGIVAVVAVAVTAAIGILVSDGGCLWTLYI